MAVQVQIEELDAQYRTFMSSMNASYAQLDAKYRQLGSLDYENAKDAKAI